MQSWAGPQKPCRHTSPPRKRMRLPACYWPRKARGPLWPAGNHPPSGPAAHRLQAAAALRHGLLSRGPQWPSRRGWPLWTRVPGKHTVYRHVGWVGMPAKGGGSAPLGSYDEAPRVARIGLIALTRFDTKIGVALMNRANPAGFPGHYLSILATLFCLPSLFCQTGCRVILVVPQSSRLVPQSACSFVLAIRVDHGRGSRWQGGGCVSCR